MKLEQIKAGMLIAYKSSIWAKGYDLIYIVKVTPKSFRLLQFFEGYGDGDRASIFKNLWPKGEIGEDSRLASNKEKAKIFKTLFTKEVTIE